ncbi:lipopolysaccharide biosynthesis protein [uncultured Christiangramia sp.]|uniref:lipopolysaccharide biosynthesis protein n=1 Tax=uncultured Christiangramia sp. TaxID=503836 RepID=UPI002621F33F|nr:lipopolysaccharide biosynthesis protein [uncultured Christiangramia sp.]
MWKGIFFNAVAKYSGVVINLIITAILSRVLAPEEFGIIALVFVFIGFFNLFGNLGLGPAIVQKIEITEEDIGSIFVFSSLMALTLAILFFLSSGYIARFYDEPKLIPVVKILSLSVFFNIISIVPTALNKKALRFKQMGIVNVSVQAFAGVIAIILALNNFSYYALIFQNVLTGFLVFVIFFYLYPIKKLALNILPLKQIASYSSFQFGYNFIVYISRNLDNLLIGKYLGNAPLGYYNKSYSLVTLPINNLTHVISPVLHPVLAKHQDDLSYIHKSYLNIIKILSGIGFPLAVFLFFTAEELIFLFFGPQWESSVPVFKILALSVGLRVCTSSSSAIFQATNRTNLLFLSGVVSAVLMAIGIVYGVFYGRDLVDIGYGLLTAYTLDFFVTYYLLIVRTLHKSLATFFRIFVNPLLAGIVLVFFYYVLSKINYYNIYIEFISNTIIFLIVTFTTFALPKNNRKIIMDLTRRNK